MINAFQAAHVATKAAMLRQANKHPSAHKSYRELFALCLKGYYIQQRATPVAALEWATIGGTND